MSTIPGSSPCEKDEDCNDDEKLVQDAKNLQRQSCVPIDGEEEIRKSVPLRRHLIKKVIGFMLIIFGVSVLMLPVLMFVQSMHSQQELEQQWEKALVSQKTSHKNDVPVVSGSDRAATTNVALSPIKLSIPKIGLDTVVVEGISNSALKRGPGHLPDTAMPGQYGNCCIAGHRNMYGWWFYKLDRLSPGDKIVLSTPNNDYVYSVTETFTVLPNNTRALMHKDGCVLTLITCTPVHRPTHRLIVVAKLEE